MNNYNNATVQGYVAFDPEVKDVANGYTVGKLRLAFKSRNGTSYIDVDVWDKTLIELIRQLEKGEEIKICGELRSSSWTTQTGEKRNKVSITAETLERARTGYQNNIV